MLAPGIFTQSGGTTTVNTVQFNGTASNAANFSLSGGTLVSLYLDMGIWYDRSAHGIFTQSGGFHTNVGSINIGTNAQYHLTGGIAAIDQFGVSGRYEQTGGTNFARVLGLGEGGVYRFMGGYLVFEQLSLARRSEFHRRGTFGNEGAFTPGIFFAGGTFFAGSGTNQIRALGVGGSDSRDQSLLDLETNGPSVLRFAASHEYWGEHGTLLITNWAGGLEGGGADRIYVARTQTALRLRSLTGSASLIRPGCPRAFTWRGYFQLAKSSRA